MESLQTNLRYSSRKLRTTNLYSWSWSCYSKALSLIGELIYGTKASWQDPVKYNFAHGGKDGVPYPVAREVYDKSIKYLSSAIEGAEIERIDRIQALKKLAQYSARIFNTRVNQR